MTTAVKEKKPFLPQRRSATPSTGGSLPVRAGGPARAAAVPTNLVVGGEPRVHLLPVEVIERKKLKALKRKLLTYGVIVVVLVIAAYGVATFVLTTAQTQLDSARSQTAALLVQQAKYGQVTKVNTDISSIKAAQVSTTTQEILWAPLFQEIEKTLPPDVSIGGFTASIDTPAGTASTSTSTGAVPAIPLQGAHIATATLEVTMAQSEVPGWLDRLPSITGYVDDEVAAVTESGTGRYAVSVTLHLGTPAVSGRFSTNGGSVK